ncbi:LacI family DNA-binding transcriptional regulator [Nocardiopsis synnemataformans]|uniref:LacI family DNA-binding transcriptional regulator n=1 Tax=Nocardiopsis synnemataformans TaxID=61305 RepID=UPI003EC01FD5
MTPPAKRPTSVDVARAAGVSRTTVSFVLNDRPGQSIPDETRRRVTEAARRLGYRPHASARALAAGRSDIVLLAVPGLPLGASISRFVEELDAALADHGLTLVTHLTGERGRSLADVCASVDASAVVGFGSFDQETARELRRAGAAIVFPTGMDDSPVTRPVGRMQAEHLIARGHRRLGYALPGHPHLLPMGRERLRGAEEACDAAGIAPPVVLDTTLESERAARVVARWSEESVTGVCAFNDETAVAVLAGMREQELSAPEDMAVIGVDDIPTARLTVPALTTVRFDLREVARRRAAAVVEGLAGRDIGAEPSFANPHVVERATT